MDPGALKDELTCAVCLQVYQDPVALPCQHSFCLKCIEGVWAQTAGPGRFECPQCRRKFNPRPSLERNFTLCNIVEKYNCSQPSADSAHIVCDNCDENPNPAVKTCLKCEISLCSLHLKPHLRNKAFSGHTLIEPVADLTGRQCSDHKELLNFYCKDDTECVCVSCAIIGKHKSHTLLSLDDAQATIKRQINELKGKLSKSFSEWRRKLEEDEESSLKLIDEEELRVVSQIRSCYETLNKRVEQITSIDGESQRLVQRDPLSFIQNSKLLLSRVTETQRVTDPDVPVFTLNLSNASQFLQKRLSGWKKYHSDILGIIAPTFTEYRGPSHTTSPSNTSSGAAPVPGNILQMLTGINERAGIAQGKNSLTLDPKTANCNLVLSDDLRSATWTEQKQPYPPHPERFKDRPQVLCSQSFSSGAHSWDVETDGDYWVIGIMCKSVEREGENSGLGNSNKSWCIYCGFGSLWVRHNSHVTRLRPFPSNNRIRVRLNYNTGTLSFQQVADALINLHTFKTKFTEPVFPAFYCRYTALKLLN
ncbi:E3 ubiquitin/ISG15 ligase TRIM25-like isoform X2 [Mustelus asterias]